MHAHGTPAWRASLFFIPFACLVGAAAGLARGQQPQFRSTSDLVVLHVNVFDGRSDAVPNLPRSAFHIVEDEVPQELTFFDSEDVPVAVGLVIDNSTSMLTRRNMVVAGTDTFAQSSHPEDQLFTLLFNEYVTLGLPKGVLFTHSQALIQASIQIHPPGGLTAVRDAVVAGLEHLEEATHQKHALIVLSDGEDNASRLSEADMLTRATRSSALIYSISTADLDSGVGDHQVLRKLAKATGGTTYRPDTEAKVIASFKEIATNLRRGYSLGYAPTNTERDGKYRRVKVMVRAAGYKNLSVSARDGYLAPGLTPAR
jgi:Ca-activated chloride channel family protein